MGVYITGTASNTDTLAHNIDTPNISIIKYTIYYVISTIQSELNARYFSFIRCFPKINFRKYLIVYIVHNSLHYIINIKFEIT